MGNCGITLDCAACYSKGCSSKISAEPDIVGPGVSQACGASFDFTYLCKVLGVILSYVCHYHRFDHIRICL